MIGWISAVDHKLFYLVNRSLECDRLDTICPILTLPLFWLIPLVLMLYLIIRSEPKKGLTWALLLLVLFAVSDFVSSGLLKPFFARFRPCRTLPDVHLLAYCSKGFSFPSGHATNSSAIATFSFVLKRKTISVILIFVALLVSFTRVYVGVHYPTDIFFGWAIGAGIAYGFIKLFKLIEGKMRPK
ncbi:hypothetical protein DRQ19_00150 [bacterium]|nr:MAG: hypothetical protein DRQ19_00150 [bacterium]